MPSAICDVPGDGVFSGIGLTTSLLALIPVLATLCKDLILLLLIISMVLLHLQQCLHLPLPKDNIENPFDFLAAAVYSCLGLGKNFNKLLLSSIFFNFHFLVVSFKFPNVLLHLLYFCNSSYELHSCALFHFCRKSTTE